MHHVSRKLVRIGIIIVAIGVTMGLLFGLALGPILALGDTDHSVGIVVQKGFGYTAGFTFYASLVTLAGGVGAIALGLTLKVVALGAGYLRRH